MTTRIVKTHVDYMGTREEVLFHDPQPDPPAWTEEDVLRHVGRPQPRIDGAEIVTGRALYAGDIMPPGSLVARIVRCPFPHATQSFYSSTPPTTVLTPRGLPVAPDDSIPNAHKTRTHRVPHPLPDKGRGIGPHRNSDPRDPT